MCDPATLAIAGGFIAGAGQLYSGFSASQSYNDQATLADRQAVMEGQAGAYEMRRVKARNDRVIADNKQQYISSGIALEGSAAEVIADNAREASLDEQAVLYGAQVRSENKRFEARLARKNATSAIISGVIGAASSVAGGFSQSNSFKGDRTRIVGPYQSYTQSMAKAPGTLGGIY